MQHPPWLCSKRSLEGQQLSFGFCQALLSLLMMPMVPCSYSPPGHPSQCLLPQQLSHPLPPGQPAARLQEDSPGLLLAKGLIIVAKVEGPGKVPGRGMGREGRGQCPGPSSAPSEQSQTPSHSWKVGTQMPSAQDTSPGRQSPCPAARREEPVPGHCPLPLLLGTHRGSLAKEGCRRDQGL